MEAVLDRRALRRSGLPVEDWGIALFVGPVFGRELVTAPRSWRLYAVRAVLFYHWRRSGDEERALEHVDHAGAEAMRNGDYHAVIDKVLARRPEPQESGPM